MKCRLSVAQQNQVLSQKQVAQAPLGNHKVRRALLGWASSEPPVRFYISTQQLSKHPGAEPWLAETIPEVGEEYPRHEEYYSSRTMGEAVLQQAQGSKSV